MSATLKLTHKTIGVEVRRGTYDVVVDGKHVRTLELNETIDIPVNPGRHTLQVRNGRNSSRTKTFDVVEGEIASFRCSGKASYRSFSCPSSFPTWHSRSSASRRNSPNKTPSDRPPGLIRQVA